MLFNRKKTDKPKAKTARSGQSAGTRKLFHGVALRSRAPDACCAMTELEGQRFLSEEAPLLPLAGCDNPQGCKCVYEHFDERRDSLRREADIGLPMRLRDSEQRAGRGRRITDS